MASATWKVALTMIVPMALGIMWRKTIAARLTAHHLHGLDVLTGPQRQGLAPHQTGRRQP